MGMHDDGSDWMDKAVVILVFGFIIYGGLSAYYKGTESKVRKEVVVKSETMPLEIYFLVTETENVEFDKLDEVYEYVVEFKLPPGTYCVYRGSRVL